MHRKIFGSLVHVDIPLLGVTDVVAKVDTGAWSGALHCTDIAERDGVLYFSPLGDKSLRTSTADFWSRHVRSASGHRSERYVIAVDMVVDGELYNTRIGLTDRRLMNREMLLGRRFLLENGILVDVALSRDDDIEAENDL